MNISTEILIVGAGMAGVAAAIGAARAGRKVLLIENHLFPGGAATGAEVGTICGLFQNGKTENSAFLVDGFAKEFAEKLMHRFQLRSEQNHMGLHYLPYKVDELKLFLEEELASNGVLCMFDTEFLKVKHVDGILQSALVFCNNQEVEIDFQALVDCSGKAVVASKLNHPMVETAYFQATSISFYVVDSLMDGTELMNFKLIRALKLAQSSGVIDDGNIQLFVIPGSYIDGKIGFKLTLPWEFNPAKDSIELHTQKAKDYVTNYFQTLQENIAIFQESKLESIADDLGWRTANRPVGKYILTEEDVVSGRKFTDACAKSAWPIEEWIPNQAVQLQFIQGGDYYEIPEACLQSPIYDNFFFAGRIISATDRAIASARVMGTCLQTGFSSGILASKFYD